MFLLARLDRARTTLLATNYKNILTIGRIQTLKIIIALRNDYSIIKNIVLNSTAISDIVTNIESFDPARCDIEPSISFIIFGHIFAI